MLKIPPFFDAHIHWLRQGKPMPLPEARECFQDYVRSGIFSVQEMGTAGGLGLAIKKNLERTPSAFPKVRSCGRALYRRGAYGSFLGWGVEGAREIQKAVAELAGQGADFLKIIQSGLVSLNDPGQVTAGGFNREELQVIAAEAQRHRLPVHCHVNGEAAIRQVSGIPIASIEHGFFIHRETLHRLREQGIAWTPTIYALAHLEIDLDAERRKKLRQVIDRHLESVRAAVSLGVRLQVGTDSGASGSVPGESFFAELRYLKKAGLTLDQILEAACVPPAAQEPGSYLLVREDFIERGAIESAFFQGRHLGNFDIDRERGKKSPTLCL